MAEISFPPFPPTADHPFKHVEHGTNQEYNAEGFSLVIPVFGKRFRIGVQLPLEAAYGPLFIIFYASFYSKKKSNNSIVETGLSYSSDSLKRLNFNSNAQFQNKDDHFKIAETISGQYYEYEVDFTDKGIMNTVNKLTLIRGNPKYDIDTVHLVIAAGNRQDAYFSEAAITLLSIDGKSQVKPGKVEWVNSATVTRANSRFVLTAFYGNGMKCWLPRPLHLESGPANALGGALPLSG